MNRLQQIPPARRLVILFSLLLAFLLAPAIGCAEPTPLEGAGHPMSIASGHP